MFEHAVNLQQQLLSWMRLDLSALQRTLPGNGEAAR